jgi:hypothetical protein
VTVKFNRNILFARRSVVSFISGAYSLHNKKMNVHIIHSNSESDEEMSNLPPEIADDNCNNCVVTINYVNKFCWQADKKYYKKSLMCINKFIHKKSRYIQNKF